MPDVPDEPTAGLSPADSRQLIELLKPVARNRTVITHDPAVAAQADHMIVPEPSLPWPARNCAELRE